MAPSTAASWTAKLPTPRSRQLPDNLESARASTAASAAMPASDADAGRGEVEQGGFQSDLHLRGERDQLGPASFVNSGVSLPRKPRTSEPTA